MQQSAVSESEAVLRHRLLWAGLLAFAAAIAVPDLGAQQQRQGGEPQPAADDNPQLPPDFQLPKAIPEELEIEQSIYTDEQDTQFERTHEREYRGLLRRGVLQSDNDRDLIRRGATWRLYRMTLPKHRKDLQKRREEILQDITAKLSTAPPQARDLLLQTLTEKSRDLLNGNLYVRINAVILLAQLNQDPGGRDQSPVPYTPAAEVLLEVVADPQQPDAVKIWAVQGLARIGLQGTPGVDLRIRMAKAMAEEMARPDADEWLQRCVAQGLGMVGVVFDRSNQPFVADALARAMADPKRTIEVRAQAARSLGGLQLTREINVSAMAYEMVRLARDMAEQYNRQPDWPHWPRHFLNLWWAFRHRDKSELDRHVGLLNKADRNHLDSSQIPTVREAAGHVRQLTEFVLNQGNRRQPIGEDRLRALNDWLRDNQPGDFRLTPNAQPFSDPQVPAVGARSAN